MISVLYIQRKIENIYADRFTLMRTPGAKTGLFLRHRFGDVGVLIFLLIVLAAFVSGSPVEASQPSGPTAPQQSQQSKPKAPSNLTATAVSPNQINLAWRDNSDNETGFEIWMKQGANGEWVRRSTTPANANNWGFGGIAAGMSYGFRVWAVNGAIRSDAYAEASAATPAIVPVPAPAQAAAKPTGLSPGAAEPWGPTVSTLTPTLSWAPVPGVKLYNVAVVHFATVASQKPTYVFQANNLPGPSVAVPVGKLEHNQVYLWWVFYLPATSGIIESDRRYFMTPQAPPPPVPSAKLTLRQLGPGTTGRPPGPIPMLPSPEVSLEWEVDHPELVGHFTVQMQPVRTLSKNVYTLLPEGYCPGAEIKVPASANQKRYSARALARETGCKTKNYAWWVSVWDTHGEGVRYVGVGGWMENETRMLFFQVNPAPPPLQLRLIGPGAPSAPWPAAPSRDVTLEWEVDHPELVSSFELRFHQDNADQSRSCELLPYGWVHSNPNQKRYSFQMTAGEAGCKGNTYRWSITVWPVGKPGMGVSALMESGSIRFQVH